MAATYVHSNTVHALEAAGRDFPDWPLFLTGHSMGGAPANSCSFWDLYALSSIRRSAYLDADRSTARPLLVPEMMHGLYSSTYAMTWKVKIVTGRRRGGIAGDAQ